MPRPLRRDRKKVIRANKPVAGDDCAAKCCGCWIPVEVCPCSYPTHDHIPRYWPCSEPRENEVVKSEGYCYTFGDTTVGVIPEGGMEFSVADIDGWYDACDGPGAVVGCCCYYLCPPCECDDGAEILVMACADYTGNGSSFGPAFRHTDGKCYYVDDSTELDDNPGTLVYALGVTWYGVCDDCCPPPPPCPSDCTGHPTTLSCSIPTFTLITRCNPAGPSPGCFGDGCTVECPARTISLTWSSCNTPDSMCAAGSAPFMLGSGGTLPLSEGGSVSGSCYCGSLPDPYLCVNASTWGDFTAVAVICVDGVWHLKVTFTVSTGSSNKFGGGSAVAMYRGSTVSGMNISGTYSLHSQCPLSGGLTSASLPGSITLA